MTYAKNHYILILQNNYTKKTCVLDVYDESDNKLFHEFKNFTLPDGMPNGEYNFYLVWDVLEYTVKLNNDILKSIITCTGLDGETYKLKLSDLTPTTGIIKFGDNDVTPVYQEEKKSNYYSL